MNRDEWSRAHEVFQAVVELDDDARQDTLDRLGHEAPGVAATVRALLDGHSMQTGPFDRLEQALTGGLQAVAFDDDEAPLARDAGTRWLRLEELGRGGMGVVHLAEDRSLGRRVAIKTLAADVATSPGARRRLLQEARTVASLDHPNIVPIHEVGVDDHDALFLVFGYAPGETLKARLEREGRLPPDEALAAAAGVARALAAAHERGIVHRDVKPSNVLVGDDGTVRLTDFGIARRPGVSGPASAFGTPAYMAPEAREGSPPDPRTDVWAMGVVLHEMLTGHRPEVDAAGRAGAV
ncbi:MAG: serine/threonine-protein kinase, partial [Longimicrobiales bacterium]